MLHWRLLLIYVTHSHARKLCTSLKERLDMDNIPSTHKQLLRTTRTHTRPDVIIRACVTSLFLNLYFLSYFRSCLSFSLFVLFFLTHLFLCFLLSPSRFLYFSLSISLCLSLSLSISIFTLLSYNRQKS